MHGLGHGRSNSADKPITKFNLTDLRREVLRGLSFFIFNFQFFCYNSGMFTGIVGHKRAIGLLENDLKSGSISHAYIFSGPSNVGKSTVALRFARNAICGCGSCQDCILVEKKAHPDILIFDGNESIKIEESKEIQKFLGLKPHQAKRKIVIVEDIERMTREAANCLLKILEEPNGNSVVIFTAKSKQNILETIVSRCRVVVFTLVSDKDILDWSKDKGIGLFDNDCFFFGKPGLFLGNSSKEESDESRQEIVDMLPIFFRKGDYKEKFDLVKGIADSPNIVFMLEILSFVFRDMMLFNSGFKSLDNIKYMDVDKYSRYFKPVELEEILVMIEKIKDSVTKGINTKIFLEALVLKMEGA